MNLNEASNDFILIGAGIMSATLGVLIYKLIHDCISLINNGPLCKSTRDESTAILKLEDQQYINEE